MENLQALLRNTPLGTRAIVLLGDDLALVGAYDMGAVVVQADAGAAYVDVGLVVPGCSCEDPDNDIDPDCRRHYPQVPADLVARLLPAAQAGLLWELGGANSELPGVETPEAEQLANALTAVLTVLLRPGRNGIVR